MKNASIAAIVAGLLLAASPVTSRGAEAAWLDKDNWPLVPGGKEVDAIYGDLVMRNDKVVAVIGSALPTRQLNLRIKQAQGCVLDLALLSSNNDQLTTYQPHAYAGTGPAADKVELVKDKGPEVVVRATRNAREGEPVEVLTDYTLRDGDTHIQVVTRRRNTSDKPAKVRLTERLVHEKPAIPTPAGEHSLIFTYDRYFGMGYGLTRADGGKLSVPISLPGRTTPDMIDYPDLVKEGAGPGGTQIDAGNELVLTRYLLVGDDAAAVQRAAFIALKREVSTDIQALVTDDRSAPLAGAAVSAYPATDWAFASAAARKSLRASSFAFSKSDGGIALPVPAGDYVLVVETPGREPVTKQCTVAAGGSQREPVKLSLPPASRVAFDVTDGDGNPSPAKVQFIGAGSTPTPNLGPDQRADGCRNLWFSVKGQFEVPLPPGEYYIVISRGPEFDAVWRTVTLAAGATAKVSARLPRVVDTKGWISADFHNHTTLSGDNSTQVEGRLAALIAEHVEFAACTEHQRITSYKPYLKAMGAEKLMATSDGIELTGTPLPLNHQNAFPLKAYPNTQFGGGPEIHTDPRVQIQRLRDHDGGSEKLVQQNHPDIGWLVYDRDGDAVRDSGYGTLEYTDVIEVFQTSILGMKPTGTYQGNPYNNPAFNWLQLLNQGHRIPGVANTDAHHCFHDSGTIRNWVKSATDDPAVVKEMDVVRESKQGRLVMSSGPFLEVSLNGAGPGDDLKLEGEGQLKVRVQCPNWFDVDRVQVLLNGHPDPALNFTRGANPKMFADGVVKFDQTIPVRLPADAHVIVVAAGEHSTTGPVMGPGELPVAISNPIFVDADGDGFKPTRDTLGAPLPVKKGS
jgi:hypothetical protein